MSVRPEFFVLLIAKRGGTHKHMGSYTEVSKPTICMQTRQTYQENTTVTSSVAHDIKLVLI